MKIHYRKYRKVLIVSNSNRAYATIREGIKISSKGSLGYYELKKHNPWFDKGCLE
jgi:hypothetical protein